jgi:outer membrane protein TolC
MRHLLLHIAMLASLSISAQDGSSVLTRRALLQLVADNHPAAKQAQLRNAMGDAVVRSARGGFDPVAAAAYSEKQFDGKNYYEILDAGLRVPTWYGVEFFGGYTQSSGEFLDDQNFVPVEGQLRMGATVQVGQGLFIDKRRAELRKAQAYQDMAEAERQRLLNAVFLAALADHVDWVASYQELLVARSALDMAEVRLGAVRGNFIGGDMPAIDTLEALLQVQDRQMRLQTAELGFRVAGLQLSNHLWNESLEPLELTEDAIPDTMDLLPSEVPVVLDSLRAEADRLHPDLLEREAKLRQLEIERRFRAEMLKPRLDLSGALLSRGGAISGEGERDPSWNSADRQLGLVFSTPLLLRRERGDLNLAGLFLSDAEFALDRQRLVIRNHVDRRYNELTTFEQQVDLGNRMVRNYSGLLNGENMRFELGESSLFLVNQREVALLESQLKQIGLQAKYRKSFFYLDHDAGVLWRVVAGELGSTP